MAGYTRQSVADIIASAIIKAAPINAEYNAIRDAFTHATGHKHDGSSDEGAYVPLIADSDAFNKVEVDTANNRISFYSEVGGAAVEQVRIQDGAIVPVTDNDIDLGSPSSEFKNLYIDGIGYLDSVVITGGTIDDTVIGGTIPAAGTFTSVTATTADIDGGTIDGTVIGGTTPAAADFTTVDTTGNATVGGTLGVTGATTLTGNVTAANLTTTGNSVHATVDINGGTIDGTPIGASVPDSGAFTTVTTSGLASLNSADIDGGTIDGTVIGGTTPQAVTGTLITATTGFTGDLTGDVTGNVTGNLTGNTTGTHTGNISGNVAAASGTSIFNNVTVNGTLDVTGTTIANVTDPSSAQDAATKNYVDTSDALKLSLTGGTMSGALAMGTSKIIGLGTPTASTDAATKGYVDTADALKLPLTGGTMSGSIAMGGSTVSGLGAPSASTDAATKGYVDTEISNVIDAAPGALDTLNELAAALNDDPSFSTTVTNSIATKLPLAGGTMTGDITLGANKATSTATPTTADDLTRKDYVDTQDALKLDLTGGTMSGAIAMGTNKITGVDTPTNSDDAVNKSYADTLAAQGVNNTGDTMTGNLIMGANKVTSTGTPTTNDDLTRKGYVDAQDALNLSLTGGTLTGNLVMGANKVTSTASPTASDDLTRKAYVDSILGSSTAAATSAANAATSETNAASSATAAATSATNASSSETNASASAVNAAASEANAATSETNALAAKTAAETAETGAQTAETNAAISETNAGTSATAAAGSATAAATSETNAGTSETNAATSATNAAISETNAATSASNAAASYDSFDDRYLGAKASNPTVDNDGDPLLTGALYWNTTSDNLFIWDGSAWSSAAFNTAGAMFGINNLSDVSSVSTSRTNLGLGTADSVTFGDTSVGHVDLALAASPAHNEGRIFYDTTNDALAVYNSVSDITLQVGQEEYIRVYNDTGSTINNGVPVYLTGESGTVPTIAPASATTEASAYAVGLATHAIADSSYGFVTVRGLVGDIDTSGLTVGNRIHVSPTAGQLQDTAPTYPYFPTDIGICLISDASTGCIYVDVQTHHVETFRITGDARVDNDLVVGGDLTVLGTQTIASSNNVSIGSAWNYFNSGYTIGEANTTFTGSGLDDGVLEGHFEGTASATYYVRIDGVGTGTGGVDTFEWSLDNFSTTQATAVDITGAAQALSDGIEINFNATTGHTSGDVWSGTAAPVNVDTGIASNRNTGGTGVGYTHMGIFFDVSDEKWKIFSEYDPEPTGTINTAHASYNAGTLVADTFEGSLNGTASTATALATARTIAGQSFDGTANISIAPTDLTGVTATAAELNKLDGVTVSTAEINVLDGITATTTELNYVDGVTSSIQTQLNAKQAAGTYNTNIGTSTDVNTSGSTIIDAINVTDGVVDSMTTRTLTLADLGYTGATNANYITNNNQLTNGAGYTTNIGDITAVTAGSGLSGGGTSGGVTLTHANTSSQGSVNNSGRTYIQDITLDSFGHITGITSATETVVNTDTNTTYSADGNYGMTLSGTTFRLEDDRRRNSSTTDIYSGNTHDYTFYDASVGIRWYTAGAEDMRLTDGGDLHVDGNITAYSTTVSDERLKDNIKVIDGALDKVCALSGYTFDYKHDGKASAGVIAQEVEKVLPSAVVDKELVFQGEEGETYKIVQYDQLTGLLIEGIKELTERVKLLEAKLEG